MQYIIFLRRVYDSKRNGWNYVWTLSEVTDYDKICVKGINIPFIDLGKAIFYVKGENGMLYLNPMMKDKYENKPYYFVNEYRRVFFGEEKQIDELSR